jgi:hypothetical protein
MLFTTIITTQKLMILSNNDYGEEQRDMTYWGRQQSCELKFWSIIETFMLKVSANIMQQSVREIF